MYHKFDKLICFKNPVIYLYLKRVFKNQEEKNTKYNKNWSKYEKGNTN